LFEEALIPPPIQVSPVAIIDAQLSDIVREREEREREALRLYEPLTTQEAFHRCTAPEVILIGSNRSGKTTAALAEVARAVTGTDPFGKYPVTNGRCVMVAKDQKHIAEVFYDKLFKGSFKIIRDAQTGKWRALKRPDDDDRENEAIMVPLIADRYVADVSWEDKKQGVPKKVILTTGWEITFYTANSAPPQGVALDLVLFDEEIDNRLFYSECAARLGDRRGRFIWSATPQTGTDELFQLHERAIACAADEKPAIVEFHLSISDNRFFHKDEIAKLIEKYKNNPEEYKVRILGEFNHTSYLVYPEFAMDRMAHGCKVFDIPDDWNRWMVVDPGSTVCAVLFFAVPPPQHELADQRFLYDELYLLNCNSEKLAANVAEKVQGKYFTGFLIDPSSVKQDRIGGAGENVFVQYSNALRGKGVECRHSGNSFILANNDKRAGLLKVQSWLYHRPDTQRPVLQVFEDRCPNFEREMRYYRRKRRPDGTILDEPVDRNDHACDCLRYFVMNDPRWEKQPAFKKRNYVYDYFQKLKRERAKEDGSTRINFGTRVA
jgi:hypothetical protein